jgi:hypothetical protein
MNKGTKGKGVKDSLFGEYFIYENKIEIKILVIRAPDAVDPLDFSISYYARTAKVCGIVKKIRFSVP